MPHDRFFLDHFPFQEQENLLLIGEEAHHLLHVMRKKKGEPVELVNGKNQLAIAQIINENKKSATLNILTIENTISTHFQIILCQAITRANRLDTIVEKGTELGMNELWLFPGQLSEKKEISSNQFKRLEAISIAAMKQSGRLDLPKIIIKPPLYSWQELPFPAYFGDLSQDAPPFLTVYRKNSDFLFFVGPEAGFSHEEKRCLASMHVQGVCLHTNILRADTASLVALALSQLG